MPLYDILNEFQKGSSHMAAVVKVKGKNKNPLPKGDGERFEENKVAKGNSQCTTLLAKDNNKAEKVIDIDKVPRPNFTNKQTHLHQNGAATNSLPHIPDDIEDGEVIGIITLEDVFEELLQVNSASSFHFPCHMLVHLTFLSVD